MTNEEQEYRIRYLAYELWIQAGRPSGKHLDFWYQAERQLKDLPQVANDSAAGTRQQGSIPAIAAE